MSTDLDDYQSRLPGTRSLVDCVTYRASTEPSRVWATCCNFEDTKHLSITYQQLSCAIDHVAYTLLESLGEDAGRLLLWYAGPPDLMAIIFSLATSKVGHTALHMSARITDEARSRLLSQADCTIAFGANSDNIRALIKKLNIQSFQLPQLHECIHESNQRPLQSYKPWSDVAHEPFVVLHSSGSTNHPKPIAVTHAGIAVLDALRDLPAIDGQVMFPDVFRSGSRACVGFPLFHAAGFDMMASCLYYNVTAILPPIGKPFSSSVLENILQEHLADVGFVPTSVLEDLVESPSLHLLSQWHLVGFGGSPLKQEVGDRLADFTYPYNWLGSTEGSHLPHCGRKDLADWNYHWFHPSLGGHFKPREDGYYSLVLSRQSELSRFQAWAFNFPDLDHFELSDMYVKHPDKDLYQYAGRADDLIVLSNGEKLQPIEVEHLISQEPAITAALMVGTNRFAPGVVIQLESGDSLPQDRLKSLVSLANSQLPRHAHVDQNHIICIGQDITLPRSAKGTIQRKLAYDLLQTQIDAMYATAEAGGDMDSNKLDFSSEQNLQTSLCSLVKDLLPELPLIEEDQDFFEYGFDSLQAQRLARSITNITHSKTIVNASTIYQHSSPSKLGHALLNGPTPSTTAFDDISDAASQSDEEMASLLDEFSPKKPLQMALLGSTGSLGPFLLDSLLRHSNIEKIWCLNRSEDARERQHALAMRNGLIETYDQDRIEFLTVQVNAPLFGLKQETYDILTSQLTHIIHNAWSVDFNRHLSSFKPHIAGCRNLIDLASCSTQNPRILFVSSVGAANNWLSRTDDDEIPVPEEILEDFRVCEPNGYSRSKLTSEILFARASRQLGVNTTICRVGQIAGPVKRRNGVWNKSEWLPSLIETSISLGVIPNELAGMNACNWLPVDQLSDIVVEILQQEDCDTCQVVNLVNPASSSWDKLLPAVQAASRLPLEAVAFGEWLEKLQQSCNISDSEGEMGKDSVMDDVDTDKLPALKLLDFYETFGSRRRPAFSTEQAKRLSPTLNRMEAVSQVWMKHWMKQWSFT